MRCNDRRSNMVTANNYAIALFLVLKDHNFLQDSCSTLREVSCVVHQSAILKRFFYSPLFSPEEKLVIFEQMIGDHPAKDILSRFFLTLSKSHKNHLLDFIIVGLERRSNADLNIDMAEITLAHSDKDYTKTIEKFLKQTLDRKISFSYKIDESIIGGFIVRMGSKLLDRSIYNQLNQIYKDNKS